MFLCSRSGVKIKGTVRGGVSQLPRGLLQVITAVEDHSRGAFIGGKDDDISVAAEGGEGLPFGFGEVGLGVEGT